MIKLNEKQKEILRKYNIDYLKYKEINELLDEINDKMISYVDYKDEPLEEFIELEKVYDEIFYQNEE